MKEIISFASDFGLEDGSVGVVKGVINRVDSDLKINVINTLNVIFNLKTFLDSKKVKLNVLFVPLGFAWSDEVKYGKQSYDYKWEKNFKISQSGIENYTKKFLELNQISHIELLKYFSDPLKFINFLLNTLNL